MANLALRSFTTFGYFGAVLLIAIVAVVSLTSFGADSSGQQALDTATPAPTRISIGPGGDVSSIDGLMQANSGPPTIVSRDNCFRVSRHVIKPGRTVPDGTSFGGDTLWRSDPERFVTREGQRYKDVAALQAAAGKETTGNETPDCPLPLD